MKLTIRHPANRMLLCAAVVLALTPIAFSQTASAPAAYIVQQMPIGTVDADVIDPVFSLDGRHMAYVTPQQPLRDPDDGSLLAYVAPPGKKQHVAIDGKAGAEYDEIPSYPLVFSPDGTHIAYQARNGTKWCVVVDEHAGAAYDEILKPPYKPLFSPDGKHIAYTAKKNGKMVVVMDGLEGPEYDITNYCMPVFSPDSTHLAYNARIESHKDATGRTDKQSMAAVVDGKVGPAYDMVGGLVYSADSLHVAYGATKDGKTLWIVDGKESTDHAPFDPPKKPGAINAVRADNDRGMVVVIDGRAGAAYRGMGPLIFSADGKHVAYEGMTMGAGQSVKWRVVNDGKEDPAYDAVGNRPGSSMPSSGPMYSPDGKHVVYGARIGAVRNGEKWFFVMDGKEGVHYDGIADPMFSPDSSRLAYLAQKGNQILVVMDGKEGASFDAIPLRTLVFSPDSQHLVFKAQKGNKWVVVADGQSGAEFDVIGPLTFNADGAMEFLAIKQNTLYRVKYSPRP